MTDTTTAPSKTAEQAAKWGKNRGYRCHDPLYLAYMEEQRRRGRTLTDGLIEHMERVTGVKNEPAPCP